MRIRRIVVVAGMVATLLAPALAAPARASATFRYGEQWGDDHAGATGGTWSARASLSHDDGSFSVSVAIDDPAGAVDLTRPRTSGEAYGYNLVTLDPGRYEVTAVLTGMRGTASASGLGRAQVFVVVGLGVCNLCVEPVTEHPLVDSHARTSIDGMLVATTTVVVTRRATYNLVVTFVADAADGVEVLDPSGQPAVAAHQGTASAAVTGVVESLAIRPVS